MPMIRRCPLKPSEKFELPKSEALNCFPIYYLESIAQFEFLSPEEF